MRSRINPDRLNRKPIHHEAVMYILRLCANLLVLHDAEQPLRADPLTLEEWPTHRQDLEGCTEPVIRYSQYGQYPEGEMPKHGELLLLANRIIGELKIRNAGESISAITVKQIQDLERLAMRADCSKRVVFF